MMTVALKKVISSPSRARRTGFLDHRSQHEASRIDAGTGDEAVIITEAPLPALPRF